MQWIKIWRRGFTGQILGGLLATVLFLGTFMWTWSPPAQGASKLSIDWVVNASTYVKGINQTVVVPQGTFKGSVNLRNDRFTGNITLPPATTTIKVLGVVPVSTTFKMKGATPVTGKINLKTLHVSTSVSVDILITKATVAGVPYNVVGTNCHTSKAITMSLSGKVSLTGKSTFNGTYTMPDLANCGIGTPLLNAMVAGPGNTFTATFSPS